MPLAQQSVPYSAIRSEMTFDAIRHPIWTPPRLHALTEFVHAHPDLARKVLLGQRMTTHVTSTIRIAVPGVNDPTVLRIFWEEFKLVRSRWRAAYDEAIDMYRDRYDQPDRSISRLLQKYNVPINENESSWRVLEDFLLGKTKPEQLHAECKICYANPVTHAIVHDTHACAICQECCSRVTRDGDSKCPFCRVTGGRVVKLHVP